MPKTQIPCPQCGQPIVADIRQVFDLAQDPKAKQILLSGAYNIVQCPYCGYQGAVETPIVYHDPEKELLLTYFPPALNKSRDEQERILGRLISQITQNLPPEKRKGYLLQPQAMLTFQSLIERILEADGITKEMLQEQEKRIRLIERLLSASDEARREILEQEKEIADAQFFSILTQLLDAALLGNDQRTAEQLAAIYNLAVENTPYGQEIKKQEKSLKAAEEAIRKLGERPTLDEVVDAFIAAADDELQLTALTSVLRPVMNYEFFSRLTERIDKAPEGEKTKLEKLRDHLLKLVQEVDKAMQNEIKVHREAVESVLSAENIEQAIQEVAPLIDPIFLEILENELKEARQKGDLQRSARISQVLETIEKLTAPPPEIALIQSLLEAPNAEAREKLLKENRKLVNEALVQQMAALIGQLQSQGAPAETIQKAHEAYQQALKFYMAHQVHL